MRSSTVVSADAPERPGGRVEGLGLDLSWAAVIVAVSLGLRLAYVLDFARHPMGRYARVDEGAYMLRAGEIVSGAWLPSGPFYQDPLFPYVLAVFQRACGPDPGRLRIALACLGSLTPAAVFWAGRRGLGRSEGVVAGLIAAAYGPLVFTDGLLEKEGLGALLAALALGITAWAARVAAAWPVLVAGAAWGLLALVRANALVVAPVGAVWWAAAVVPPPGAWRVSRPLLFLLGFAAALAPATAVNMAVGPSHELILTTWQGGANFYIGNNAEATGTYEAPPFVRPNPAYEAHDFASEASLRAGRTLSPGEVSHYWFGEGLRRWKTHPADSLRLLVHKFGLLLHRFEIPDNQSPEVVRMVAAPGLAFGVIGLGVLLPLAALGLGCLGRSPFLSFVALTNAGLLSTALFFVVGRYRIPWVPGLALLAGAGLVDTARRVAARDWRGLTARWLLLAVPAAAVAWRPMADPSPDRWGRAEIGLAIAFAQAGQLGPTIDALDDARAIGPGPAARVRELMTAGPLRRLFASLASGRPTGPSGAALDRERARRLRQFPEGRAEARRLLEAILREHPDDPATLHELGAWWLCDAEDPKTRAQAVAALAKAQADPSAAVLLALVRSDSGALARADHSSYRFRLARAILTSRGRPAGSGR
jgi:hypothetical protein